MFLGPPRIPDQLALFSKRHLIGGKLLSSLFLPAGCLFTPSWSGVLFLSSRKRLIAGKKVVLFIPRMSFETKPLTPTLGLFSLSRVKQQSEGMRSLNDNKKVPITNSQDGSGQYQRYHRHNHKHRPHPLFASDPSSPAWKESKHLKDLTSLWVPTRDFILDVLRTTPKDCCDSFPSADGSKDLSMTTKKPIRSVFITYRQSLSQVLSEKEPGGSRMHTLLRPLSKSPSNSSNPQVLHPFLPVSREISQGQVDPFVLLSAEKSLFEQEKQSFVSTVENRIASVFQLLSECPEEANSLLCSLFSECRKFDLHSEMRLIKDSFLWRKDLLSSQVLNLFLQRDLATGNHVQGELVEQLLLNRSEKDRKCVFSTENFLAVQDRYLKKFLAEEQKLRLICSPMIRRKVRLEGLEQQYHTEKEGFISSARSSFHDLQWWLSHVEGVDYGLVGPNFKISITSKSQFNSFVAPLMQSDMLIQFAIQLMKHYSLLARECIDESMMEKVMVHYLADQGDLQAPDTQQSLSRLMANVTMRRGQATKKRNLEELGHFLKKVKPLVAARVAHQTKDRFMRNGDESFEERLRFWNCVIKPAQMAQNTTSWFIKKTICKEIVRSFSEFRAFTTVEKLQILKVFMEDYQEEKLNSRRSSRPPPAEPHSDYIVGELLQTFYLDRQRRIMAPDKSIIQQIHLVWTRDVKITPNLLDSIMKFHWNNLEEMLRIVRDSYVFYGLNLEDERKLEIFKKVMTSGSSVSLQVMKQSKILTPQFTKFVLSKARGSTNAELHVDVDVDGIDSAEKIPAEILHRVFQAEVEKKRR